MGMTTNQMSMIRALAENRIQDAKKFALCCCTEDTTKKNQGMINKLKGLLENGNTSFLDVPAMLSGFLIFEDVTDFNESRYYVSEREEKILSDIETANRVSIKLMELGIDHLNSTLLYGEPGTGKTMFGRYAAFKMGTPFAYINFSNLIDSYMGNTSKNIKKVFDFCKGKPCVLMLDEIDCIGLKRAGTGEGPAGELGRTTITLLQELDQLSNDQIVIAATNRDDRLDPALYRRFSNKYKMTKFSEEENVKLAVKFLDSTGIEYDINFIKEYTKEPKTQADMTGFAKQILIQHLTKNM